MDLIEKYFPGLDATARERLEALPALYREWNGRINVVSRRDIEELMVHHVVHSLAIARFVTPVDGSAIVDLGTGGGFPGIPLAVVWPQCRLHLVDRIGKKVMVAREIAASLGLDNVTTQHGDSGECRERFDYVVSRGVMSLGKLVAASRHLLKDRSANRLPPGLIALKGGDLTDELAEVDGRRALVVPLSDWWSEEWFATKQLVYISK